MKNLKELKNRIKSIQNTKQITKAMQMVSASKLKKVESKSNFTKSYIQSLQSVVEDAVHSASKSTHPFLIKRKVKNRAFVVFTSDKGMAGGFNLNLIKKVKQDIVSQQGVNYTLLVIGKIGSQLLKRSGFHVDFELVNVSDTPAIQDLNLLTNELFERFNEELIDEVVVYYNSYQNPAVQNPSLKKLLPVEEDTEKQRKSPFYDFEPHAKKIISDIVPYYVKVSLFQILMESKTGEQGARMTAMDNATTNAEDIITDLSLIYNSGRQTAITQELNEIVSGSNALE